MNIEDNICCVLVNGKNNKAAIIPLSEKENSRKNIFDSLDIKIKILDRKDHQCVDVVIKNNSDDEQFIEVRLQSSISAKKSLVYWDGVSERKLDGNKINACHGTPCDEGDIVLNDYLYPDCYNGLDPAGDKFTELMKGEFEGANQFLVFPASAVYSENSLLCIGIDPRETLTYQASGLNPNYYHSGKRVVLPGEKLTTKFIVFQCQNHQGYRTVLNRYYRWFPECFHVNPEFDDVQYGSTATFRAYEADEKQQEFLQEDFRRMHLRWIWNIEEFSEGKMVIDTEREARLYSQSKGAEGLRGLDLKGILKKQQNGNTTLGKFAKACRGITFEHATRDNVFKYDLLDSAWIRSDDRIHLRGNLASRGGNLYLLFANNTSYTEHLKSQIDKSLEYKIQGFIFDNAGGPRMYFGPAANKCRSRAFINDKIYCTSAISHVAIMEYIKSLKTKDGKSYQLAANTPADYNLSRNVDISILEGGPWHENYQWYRLQRHLMGKKSCVFWGPKGFYSWQQMSDKDLVDEAEKQVHYLLLCCFEMGFLPNSSHSIRGYKEMQDMMPLLSEICRAGWEPERQGKLLKGNVSFEQFGDAYYSIVNFSDKTEKVEIKLDIKDKFVLPRTDDKICLEKHEYLKVSFSLKAKSFIVLQECGNWNEGQCLDIEKEKDRVLFSRKAGRDISIELLETGNHIGILSDSGLKVFPEYLDFDNQLDIELCNENLSLVPEGFFDKYKINAEYLPEISVLWNGKECNKAETALEKYFSYYAASCIEEKSSVAERTAFKAGNHDTKFVLRVVDRAEKIFDSAQRKTKLCFDVQFLKPGTKPFHRVMEKDNDGRIIYKIYGFSYDIEENMKALFQLLDVFFPVVGVKAIIERKHLRIKNHNLHIG